MMNAKKRGQVDPNIGLTITCNAFSRRRAGLLAAHSSRSLISALDGSGSGSSCSAACASMSIPDMTVKAQALLKRKEEERTTCLYALRDTGSRPMQQPIRRPSNPSFLLGNKDETEVDDLQEPEETEAAVPIPTLDQAIVYAEDETPSSLNNSKQPMRLASVRTMEPALPSMSSTRRESIANETVISALTLVASTTTEEEEEDDDILSEEELEENEFSRFHEDIVLGASLPNTRWKSVPETGLHPAAAFPLIEEEGQADIEEENEEDAEDVEALKHCLLDLGQRIQAMEADPGTNSNKIQGIQASFKGLLDQLQGTVREDCGKEARLAESNPQEAIKDSPSHADSSTRKNTSTDPSEKKNHSARKSRSSVRKKSSKHEVPLRVLSSDKTKSRSSSTRTAESTSSTTDSSVLHKSSSTAKSKPRSKRRSDSSRLSASHGCISYTHDFKKSERKASTTGARPRRSTSADFNASRQLTSKHTSPRRVTSNDSNAPQKATKGSRTSERRRKEASVVADSPRRSGPQRESTARQPLDLKHLYGGTDHSSVSNMAASVVALAPPPRSTNNSSTRSSRSTNNSTRSARSSNNNSSRSHRTDRSSTTTATTATGSTAKASGRSRRTSVRRTRQ